MLSPFLIASKVFWTFLKPETWFLVLILAALWAVLRNRRGLAGGLLAVTALAYLAIGILPLGDLLLRLFRECLQPFCKVHVVFLPFWS